MIHVTNLTKRFDQFVALDNLSIHVPKGAIYGLVGSNGAGKTTLIHHLTGVYRQDRGEILIDGAPVYENPALKGRIAYIPDDIFYFPQASIHEMMKFYRALYKNFDAALYTQLRDIFRLDEKTPIRRFSKGMQKQAAFWLAICTRPDLLILDEPMDGLDPVMRRQVWSILMNDIAQRGTTVLVSSHNLRELEDVCDHVGIMHQGKMMLERSLSELQENIVKVQYLSENQQIPDGLEVLHESRTGRIRTLILRGNQADITAKLEASQPVFFDMLPLSLEEIFIYELGGVDYDIKSILF